MRATNPINGRSRRQWRITEFRAIFYKSCFGKRFEAIEIDPAAAQPGPLKHPHSVLTLNLRDDDPDGPTRRAEARVIEFFSQRLQLVSALQS